MDKVFSVRLDKSVIARLDATTKREKISKKKFIEDAILEKIGNMHQEYEVLNRSHNAWCRNENLSQSIVEIKEKFQKGYKRFQRNEELY